MYGKVCRNCFGTGKEPGHEDPCPLCDGIGLTAEVLTERIRAPQPTTSLRGEFLRRRNGSRIRVTHHAKRTI